MSGDALLRKQSQSSGRQVGERRVSFSWKYLYRKFPPAPTAQEMEKIKTKLAEYEQLTPKEFKNHYRKQADTFKRLHKPAELAEEIVEMKGPFYFRIGRDARILGFMGSEVFYITEIDKMSASRERRVR